ncbi:MAG: Hpt domain-containing protein [Acidobacteriia bacterium]|nr:Hpt domain-containing protein [Terriglobia bacterium]
MFALRTARTNPAWTLPAELAELAHKEGVGLLHELFAEFETDTAARLETMCEALTKGNLTRTRSEAHTIKGSAVQVGALGLARLCRRMEQAADAGEMDATATLFEEAQFEFARVARELVTIDLRKILTQPKSA